MSIARRLLQRMYFVFMTIIYKIKYRKNLTIDGVLQKRRDTQILISESGRMKIGKRCSFQRNCSFSSIGGELVIGDKCSFNRNCIVICRDSIKIDENVLFGPNVIIYDHDHCFSENGLLPEYRHGSVIIEKGCWIAANVTILRNTHIGECCVIGAGTIVQGDIPAHSLVISNRDIIIKPITSRKEN